MRGRTTLKGCLKRAGLAHELLSSLGRSWSVADEAGLELGRLIMAAREAFDANATVCGSPVGRQGYEDSGNMVPLQLSRSSLENPDMPVLDGREF